MSSARAGRNGGRGARRATTTSGDRSEAEQPRATAAGRGGTRGARGGRGGRLAGGGARGAPPPPVVAPARGRQAATRGARGAAVRRGAAATPVAARRAPIVGGRQADLVRQIHVRLSGHLNRAAGAGFAYRVGRGPVVRDGAGRDESEEGDSDASSILEDSDEEGDDVNEIDDDSEEEEDDHGDNSLIHFIVPDDPDSDLDDEDDSVLVLGMSDEDDEDGEGTMDEDGLRGNETFSQEVEEFELMEERENQAQRKAEERLRKREDKEEKENKSVLRTDMFGACTVCAEDEVTDPVGCIHCANFIGCRKCANRWYRMSKENDAEKLASCPLCRQKWPGPIPEVGDMLDLVKCA